MKVLHIISSLKMGGAERALCNFLEQQVALGHQHHVAYFHSGPCLEVLHSFNIPTYQINGGLYRYDPIAYWRLNRLIKTIKPDLLHTSLWAANIMGRLLAKRWHLPIINELHGNNADEGCIRNWLDRATVPMASCLVAVSDTVKMVYTDNIIKRQAPAQQKSLSDRLIVIKNGINAAALTQKAMQHPLTRRELGIEDQAFIIGAVGRLEPIKSYDILVKAVALLVNSTNPQRPLCLCIIGDGSQRTMLETLATQLGIAQSVRFMGMRSDAYRFYPLFDCFALSSQSEGLSIALLEAMSFGLPIITTHAHTTHDVITDGIEGFLVPPNNPARLAQAISRLYSNPKLQQIMANAACNRVQTAFTIERVVEGFNAVYNRLLNP